MKRNHKPIKYTKEFLEEQIKDTTSCSDLMRKLGLSARGGGAFKAIKNYIKEYQIPIPWNINEGRGWSKGKTAEDNNIVAQQAKKISRSNEEVFCINAPLTCTGSEIKPRLLKLGWENKCAICGIKEWLNNPITLDVDHINGINNDNRLENLRFLCPNCHRQTDTWGNKNRNRNNSGLRAKGELSA